MEQESKTEIEALREQVDQLTQMNVDMVAVVRKLTTDLNTLAQLVILGRGRVTGCRVCRKHPDPGDPAILEVERAYCRNGHNCAPLSPDTQRMLAGEIFS
jgi:hypothetical protein